MRFFHNKIKLMRSIPPVLLLLLLLLYILGCNHLYAKNSPTVTDVGGSFLMLTTLVASADSELGYLRTKKFKLDDMEMRFWHGYGTSGTYGFILRRIGGEWSYLDAEIEYCDVNLPVEIRNKILEEYSPDSIESYLAARKYVKQQYEYNQGCPKTTEPGLLFTLDTVHIKQVHKEIDASTIWQRLVSYGILDLPQERSLPTDPVDGIAYIIEVKIGENYKNSIVVKSDVLESNKQVQIKVEKIFNTIQKYRAQNN